MHTSGKIILISGYSGAGKSALTRASLKCTPDLHMPLVNQVFTPSGELATDKQLFTECITSLPERA